MSEPLECEDEPDTSEAERWWAIEEAIEEACERVGDEGAPVARARAAGLSWLAEANEAIERVGLEGAMDEDAAAAGCCAPERLASLT